MKRLLDIVLSLAAILLSCPLLLTVVAMIRLEGGGPVLFRQERVGLRGRSFHILKFRTMRPDGQGLGITVAGDDRITPLGRRLRSSKLDELPQLFNVLKGEMSLVGPRPELPAYVALWAADDRARVLSVRPGITDFASLIFRQEESLLAAQPDPEDYYRRILVPQKLRLARYYVRTRSCGLDLWLLAQTARSFLKHPTRIKTRLPRTR